MFFYRRYKRFEGELGILYILLYSLARTIAEFWREPDRQLGFIYGGWLTQGMLLSMLLALVCFVIYIFRYNQVTVSKYN